MLKSVCLIVLLGSGVAQAAPPEMEQNCLKMYQKSLSKSRRQNVCSCVMQNLKERFDKAQLEELQQIYRRKLGRYEASKDEKKKAYLEFDSMVHAQCLQNTQWRRPVEDLGRPDEL